MSKLAALIAVLAATLAPAATAQVPGAYPHLQLTDGVATLVPPNSGPFDNSGVYHGFAGQSFQAKIGYASAGQPNPNVLWALLVSTAKTPFPTNVTPPQLFTMPSFILLLGTPVNLDAFGHGSTNLFVPSGVLDTTFYVQGLVYDSTSVPALRLANGVAVDVDVPSYSVKYSWLRAAPAEVDETLIHDINTTIIGPQTLPHLKPVGTQAPPAPVAGPGFFGDDVRFLPLVPNAPDEPINPLARPYTKMAATATATDTTLVVLDTTGFPTRGKIIVAMGNSNLWADLTNTNAAPPRCEIVAYDGKLKDRFLNCLRVQPGTCGAVPATTQFPHNVGEQVVGEWTFATTSGARARERVSLDCDNADMPHIIIPAFTAPAANGDDVTMDLDLYLFESRVEKIQGFVVFDRVTCTWRVLEGTLKNTIEGRWNPMICLAPDGRSFLAELTVTQPAEFAWDNLANPITLVRTDGRDWPASDSEAWTITHETGPALTLNSINARGRRVWMPATAILGPDPDNYVAFIGLAYKWKMSSPPGKNVEKGVGYEPEWVRHEVIVHDYIELPLVGPDSSKGLPVMPRPYIVSQFGMNGFNEFITRFDPDVLVSADKKMMLMTAGGGNNSEGQEDAYVIRNVGIAGSGAVTKVLGNITGFFGTGPNPGVGLRAFAPGGHGQGRKAAISPSGTKVAMLAKRNKINDWLVVCAANGANYGKVKFVYDDGLGNFKMPGPYQSDAVITGLRWVDDTRLVFMMGKSPYADPVGLTPANAPVFDLFSYDLTTGVMANLTKTSGGATDFSAYGRIKPAGYFAAPGGEFFYFLRYGGISAKGSPSLPLNTQVMNLIGVNAGSLHVFPLTGNEFDATALVPNLDLPASELVVPIESAATMQFVEGSGIQHGMLWFTANKQGGNGSDDIFAANLDMPFVAFQATNAAKPSLSVSNLVPNPYGGTVAFARTDGADPYAATQHPFVVDLDNFLFERDLLPVWTTAGVNKGRVMDGSLHFIAPSGSAGDALVFSFGIDALPTGISLMATPAYYPLAGVSDVLSQPTPVVIPLVDTFLLGTDYRFYVNYAAPADG